TPAGLVTNPIFKHSLWELSECLVSPATPYIGMPEIQESDLKMKSKAWKYATAIVSVSGNNNYKT
ncbi:MAG: hypothetical protein N0E38_03325, partial [Candidatus Thiodiazotropha endolucinida]|nr:hypothetical protein [Candidatus Thiodiazotropha taylori]MCW4347978.1 hypothetical protein [Candidatus Thiodiazotropha endolucinida]